MCGIAGVLGASATAGAAEALIAPLAHRGPDGVRVEARAKAALAHARLSIIDLDCGWQPLTAAGSTVVGNGEIYNYLELAEAFGLGDRLRTGSDFEPLLHLYAREGEAAFARLRGMFAFCLIGVDGRTWLVRDAFGIKPLYVEATPGAVRFASELGAFGRLAAADAAPRLRQLLALNYVVDEPPDGPRRLAPGSVVEVVDGALGVARRTPALPATAPPYAATREARLDQLDAVLEQSVRLHQRSDVPYGLFLSGGIDSCAVATLMARLNARPVVAYTCGFDVAAAPDERGAAERVARALDLDWREIVFGEADFWRVAPQVAAALDDPTTDYACLPTWRLAEAARGELKVVLSGEGGDELFGGYGRYRRALRPRWLGGRPAAPRIAAAFLKPSNDDALARWRRAAQAGPEDRVGWSRLQHAQADDIATWLPDDLLLKLDRCLMAHGLEGRTPFLDREVAAFAFHLPDADKVRGRHGKHLLRAWLARTCPAAAPWSRKRGFTTPVAAWIAPRAADLGPRVAACEGIATTCDLEAVRAAFLDPAAAASRWPLLFAALWWTIHVDGAAAEEAAREVFGPQ